MERWSTRTLELKRLRDEDKHVVVISLAPP